MCRVIFLFCIIAESKFFFGFRIALKIADFAQNPFSFVMIS